MIFRPPMADEQCPQTVNPREWNAARAGSIIAATGIGTTPMIAMLGIVFALLGDDRVLWFVVDVNWALGAAVAIFSLATYHRIPFRRFNLDRYAAEYTFKPWFAFPTRMEPISARCPRWMRVVLRLCLGFFVVAMVLLSLGIPWPLDGKGSDAEFLALAACLPVACFWVAGMAAYAAMDVLLREADERKAPKTR